MKAKTQKSLLLLVILGCFGVITLAQETPEMKAKLEIKIRQLRAYSTDPQMVSAVKAHNATPASAEAKAMTNEQWHNLTLLDPFVRAVAKSPLSEYLKTVKSKDESIAKVFVSGADGLKVGFDAKTEHWTHKGMPKHELPMSGQTWIGPAKVDDSTGLLLIQVGLPVLDGEKPIGSIVFGIRAEKLR
jgi:hypothetical protein